MKIAFPTMDGQTISAHFGRSSGFLVLEMAQGQFLGRELRANGQAHPAPSHDHAEPGGCAGHGGHDHAGFVHQLQDCEAIVVCGMGGGALSAMRNAGIRVFLAEGGTLPEEAAVQLAAGFLPELEGGTCGCHGHQH